MPRVLARLPYGAETKPIEEFDFEEVAAGHQGQGEADGARTLCWMNAAYVMGTRLTDAFAKYGFCTAIRGAEGGGKVEGLPAHVFTSDDGDMDLKCPTEIGITDRREAELTNLGFLPLCHYKNTDYAVFFGAQTAQKPKKYDRPEATANAAISARLPYIMASSRFAPLPEGDGPRQDRLLHGSGGLPELAEPLDRQLRQRRPKPGQEMKARYPLREAKIEVQRNSRPAGVVQRGGLAAALAADGGADHVVADGRQDPAADKSEHSESRRSPARSRNGGPS